MATRSSPTKRAAAAAPGRALQRAPLFGELFTEQLPLVGVVLAAGLAVSFFFYGFFPDGERPFPVAGVALPVWQLLWLGLWTGYTMALVGQASGTFVLAYTASVLQFASVSLSPTCLLIAFLNPFGAVLGFKRNRQWNLDMALWLCIGGIVGAPLGPFVRTYLLSNPAPFKAVVGFVLLITALQLLWEGWRWFRGRNGSRRGLPRNFRIATIARSDREMRFDYGDGRVTLRHSTMFLIGFGIGVAGAAIGIGGGFLLVPILSISYGLPMYVIVAASIPYVIVLSAAGLLSYLFVFPLLTGIATPPDWAFGLIVAAGAIFGAWLAAKTQRFVPEGWLKWSLGAATALIGVLYVANYFFVLPFRI